MNPLVLSGIWIYPVKSLGGIKLTTAKVLQKGLAYDRRWMLVDEAGNFLTQRVHKKMAMLKLSMAYVDGHPVFTISHGDDSIVLDPRQPCEESFQSKIWDDSVIVREVSKLHSEWCSRQLEMNCRLVFFPEENSRPVDPRYSIDDEQTSLSDGYPILIIGEESLADLNEKLEQPVPMNRFRPNLVFSGGEAFDEDSWKNFQIGNNRFAGVKLCARCVMTTIDQETSAQGKEPLKTLARYRNNKGKIYFGQNVIAIDYGEIKEGDEIVLG